MKDIISTTQSLLKVIGQAHWALAGLLVVSNVLERFEAVSANRDECLSLLEEMYNLAQYVKQLKERERLRDGMDDLIQEALDMIAKASVICFAQIKSSKISRFCSATGHKKELVESQQELEKLYKRMKIRFDICLYDAITCRKYRPPTPLEREYPTYAVGIEEPIQKVVELLEWESQKNAVAVIVYGFGGVGKSTLADAVFARLDIVGCKYSMVRLFDDITSAPNIVELQKCILSDLMVGTEEEKKPIPDVRTFEAGQREIRRRLEKEVAFLYVDNALNADRLQELLPSEMHKAKKVRVLITARDMGVRTVCTGCKMEPKLYAMNGLPTSEARSLLERELNEGQIESSQMDQILKICGGIPKLLTVVARFISSEEDKQQAFRILMEDKDHLKGQALGDIERYVFAYDYLPERCKDPFLDICVLFKGLKWDSVAEVVGESELNILEKRALVSKDRYMHLKVHDVILKIGTIRAQETRFNFTDANESLFEELLKKDISGIKGLWFGGDGNPLEMPATKLDSMSNSLRILRFGNLKVKGKCEKIFEKLMFFQGKVACLQFGISQMTSNLKHMELNGRGSHDFEISLSDLQRLRNLRVLRLIHFEGWRKLPAELGEIIHGLRELTLSGCTSIEEIPRSISKLQYLRVLKMDRCYELRRLPEDIGSLSSLQNLDLSYCKHIEELPESTSKLRSLKVLHMGYCENLKLLPKGFESLDSLRVLSLYGCEGLQIDPKIAEKFGQIIDRQLKFHLFLRRQREAKLRSVGIAFRRAVCRMSPSVFV